MKKMMDNTEQSVGRKNHLHYSNNSTQQLLNSKSTKSSSPTTKRKRESTPSSITNKLLPKLPSSSQQLKKSEVKVEKKSNKKSKLASNLTLKSGNTSAASVVKPYSSISTLKSTTTTVLAASGVSLSKKSKIKPTNSVSTSPKVKIPKCPKTKSVSTSTTPTSFTSNYNNSNSNGCKDSRFVPRQILINLSANKEGYDYHDEDDDDDDDSALDGRRNGNLSDTISEDYYKHCKKRSAATALPGSASSSSTPPKKLKKYSSSSPIRKNLPEPVQNNNNNTSLPSSTATAPTETPVVKKVRKLRKPVAEEDIIDGFAFIAFKSFEELNRALKLGEESCTSDNLSSCVQMLKGSRQKQLQLQQKQSITTPIPTTIESGTPPKIKTSSSGSSAKSKSSTPNNNDYNSKVSNNSTRKLASPVQQQQQQQQQPLHHQSLPLSGTANNYNYRNQQPSRTVIPNSSTANNNNNNNSNSSKKSTANNSKKTKSPIPKNSKATVVKSEKKTSKSSTPSPAITTTCKKATQKTPPKTPKNQKQPKPKQTKKKKVKENYHGMVKMQGNENKCRYSPDINVGSPLVIPKKILSCSPTSSYNSGGAEQNVKSSSGFGKSSKKISDGVTDLFAPLRKDSSPNQLDNLHSPSEKKDCDLKQQNLINHEILSTSTPSSVVESAGAASATTVNPPEFKSEIESSDSNNISPRSTPPHLQTNGPLSATSPSNNPSEDQNGNSDDADDNSSEPPIPPLTKEKLKSSTSPTIKHTIQHHTLFTPYATTSITTRVSTPTTDNFSGSSSSKSSHLISDKLNHDQQTDSSVLSQSNCSSRSNSNSSGSFSFSGKDLNSSNEPTSYATNNNSNNQNHQHSISPVGFDKAGIGTNLSILGSSHKKISQSIPPVNKSTGFESIARLLDSTSSSSAATTTAKTNKNSKKSRRNSNSPNHQSGTGNHSVGTSTNFGCSSRSISPRGHSPTRERDSYSSSVSSLSRTSGTPVNGSSQLLPSNLSPLQNLKTPSWLSGTPGSRQTPSDPLPSSSSSAGATPYSSGGTPTFSTAQSAQSIYSGLSQNLSPAMFAPPMLPLSSMMTHPGAQPSPFGTPPDNLFRGSPSDLVRRDLESRFLAERNAAAGAPNPFLPRPGDIHPHLQHLPGGPNSVPPSPLFAPPYFKDLPKLGLDSPFYRTALGMPYPGFNGLLPPSTMATPFTPPSQLPTFTPKKPGRWNAMHVRIAWEIYQHQQKSGTSDTKISNPPSTTKSSSTKSTNSSNASNNPSSAATSDLMRSNHSFPDLNRPPDIGPPHFSPLLSSHTSPHPPPFDPNQALFSHLGPPISRSFPTFGPLGPAFSGLSGLGSSLLGRDISSLGPAPPSHDQWLKMQRAAQFPGWTPHPRDGKPESQGHKEERMDKREFNQSDGKTSNRVTSPRDRSRSPIRPPRTSIDNGDNDSRSSSNNSATNKSGSHRSREEASGDREKLSASERERFAHHNLMNEKGLFIPSTYSSRMFNPPSPLTPGWDSFPGMPAGRPPAVDPFRLSLFQLSERERELARAPLTQTGIRPPLPGNGPFMNLPLGLGGSPQPPRSNSSTKCSPSAGSIPLLNPSMSIGALSSFHVQHHHSSQNGPNSPATKGDEIPNSRKSKEDSHMR